MSAARGVPAAERGQCLLCGKLNHVVSATPEEVVTWDLCKGCGLAFADIADRVAAAFTVSIGGPAGEAVAQLAGQLELEDLEDEEEDVVGALELGAVLAGFRTGQWDGVATATLAHVLEHDRDGFRSDELQVLEAMFRRRQLMGLQ